MKKLSIITASALALLTTVTANATQGKTTGCNYTEHMIIQAPEGSKIMSTSSETIGVSQKGALEFLIIGTCDGHFNGTVTVKIGTDDKHYSELTIEDGEFLWDPQVRKVNSIGGFNFSEIIHPSFGFNYILRFTQAH